MSDPALGARGDAAPLLAALPDPLLRLGAGGELALNAAARERLAALPPGADWLDLFAPESAGRLRAAVERARAGEPGRESLRVADREEPALATVVPAGLGDVWVHLREARDPLQVALDLLGELGLGLTVQAADSRILHANAAAQEILGLSLDQLTGRDSLDPRWRAIHPDGRAFPGETHPAPRALETGETYRDVPMGVFHPQTETWRWLNIAAVPETLPGEARPHQVMAVFADVTERQRLQTELRLGERRFRSLVEATAQIVWDARPSGEFLPPQPGWEAFTGQSPAQYSPGGWLDAVHPDDRAGTLRDWEAAVARQDLYVTEHRLRRADGVYVPMQVRAVPVRGDEGQVREWIGAHTDISAVREAEQALRRHGAELEDRVQARTRELAEATRLSTLLLTSAGEGIFGVDTRGRITFVNPAAARMLGYGVQEMIGRDKHALIHARRADGSPYPPQENPVIQTLRDGQTRRVESDVLWHARGHAIPVSLMVTAVRNDAGEITGAVALVQDITERLRAQRHLEDANAELRRSNQDLEQFAYVASHDLQEPLRTLGSYTQLLARRYQGQLDPRADQYLEFIGAAVERMRSLIQDLLGFARISRHETPAKPVPLDRVMQDVAQAVEAARQERDAELRWDTPHAAYGHASLLTQLLTNLVGNALKFVAPGQRPEVVVRSQLIAERAPGGEAIAGSEMVQVSVQDNGIGIAPEYQERVFDIFQRLHRRESYAGNGMGLAICRRIVEHHGGRLWLDSAPEQGSTFYFTLPAPPLPHDDAQTPPH